MSGKHPTEAQIQRTIASDPDAPEATEDQLAQARPCPEAFPALAEAGRQAKRVNESDAGDPDLARSLDAALADLVANLDERGSGRRQPVSGDFPCPIGPPLPARGDEGVKGCP